MNGQISNGLYAFPEPGHKESFLYLMLMCGKEVAPQIYGNKAGISVSLNSTYNNTATASWLEVGTSSHSLWTQIY